METGHEANPGKPKDALVANGLSNVRNAVFYCSTDIIILTVHLLLQNVALQCAHKVLPAESLSKTRRASAMDGVQVACQRYAMKWILHK